MNVLQSRGTGKTNKENWLTEDSFLCLKIKYLENRATGNLMEINNSCI